MALGEELLFYNSEDAETFFKFIRTHSCTAVRRTVNSLHTEATLRGNLDQLRSFLEAMAARTDTEAEDSERRQVFLGASEELQRRTGLLESFFIHHPAGERIDQGPEWEQLRELSESSPERDLDEEEGSFVRDQYLVLTMLQENDLLSEGEGGMVLKKTLPAGEVETWYPLDLLGELPEDQVRIHQLEQRVTTFSETTFQVTVGPELILLEDTRALEELLSSLDVDEDSAARMLVNLMVKKMIVDQLVSFIREKKKATLDEVISGLKEFDFALPDSAERFRFYLHDSYIREVIDDLRKLGRVLGKDSRLRCAPEK